MLLAAFAGLTACGEAPLPEEGAGGDSAALLQAEESLQREAGQRLARAVALSLREPALRSLLQVAMAETLVKEDKVHFNSFVRGPGRGLLQAMSRSSGLSVAQLEELVRQVGSLEMYLPFKAHRSAWRGGEELLVATQYRDHETPVGFDLDGNPVPLSLEAPPETPTLVLVPAEDFDAEGNPSERGLALGRGAQVQALGDVSAAYAAWTGAYATYVYIPGDYEGWPRGDPEYELFLERTESYRQLIRCAAAGSSQPFYWNMDGSSWSTPFLIAWASETPTLTGMAMYVYEDDEGACSVRDDADYVKKTMDALKSANTLAMATQKKQSGSSVITFHHATVASKSISSGGDEFVGILSGTSTTQIDSTEKVYLIKNQNLQDVGRV
ncbi:MAG TPA: hypothetical protein VLQ93_00630, partial [Myxococcaceae bacterium]|nr:hypothetical protein [Myxococcaceae bacterium]